MRDLIYFISDAHLGSLATVHKRTQERRLVSFLDLIKDKAEAIYLMGDMFDFWHEYKMVVPRGYTRFLGKLSELCDDGIEVHYFIGNHDLWMSDYLEKECGVILHREPMTVEINGKLFYLAHGDGLGSKDWKTKFLHDLFHNHICQRIFATIHPRWALDFGLKWAKHSRMKRINGKEPPFMGADKEELIIFAKDYIKTHPDINYFIFGHRHIELDFKVAPESRLIILGEWLSLFTYAVFNGEHLFLEEYIEGDTEL